MGFKLGDISPVAGMVTGEGMTGDLMRQGFGGFLPQMIAKDAYDSKQRSIANKAAADEETPVKTMKKGGKVKASSASKRADGIAQRGKTRGRMI
jgi:hypothetical protein